MFDKTYFLLVAIQFVLLVPCPRNPQLRKPTNTKDVYASLCIARAPNSETIDGPDATSNSKHVPAQTYWRLKKIHPPIHKYAPGEERSGGEVALRIHKSAAHNNATHNNTQTWSEAWITHSPAVCQFVGAAIALISASSTTLRHGVRQEVITDCRNTNE